MEATLSKSSKTIIPQKTKKSNRKSDGDPRFSLRYHRKLRLGFEFLGKLESTYNKFNKSDFATKIDVPFEVQKILKEYKQSMKDKKNMVVLLIDREDAKCIDSILNIYSATGKHGYAIFPFFTSRYSTSGQKKIARKIRDRFDITMDHGVFLTLTFDPKRYTLIEAWRELPKLRKKILNYIKIMKKRENQKKGKEREIEYMWVIETQKNGYPHLHVIFPHLSYLLATKKIEKEWGAGFVKVKGIKNTNLGVYMSKYLAKGQGMEQALPFVWKFGIRLYGSSNIATVKRQKEHNYVVLGFTTIRDMEIFGVNYDLKEIEFFGGGGITLSKFPVIENLTNNNMTEFKVRHDENVPF